ncbi:hypothetical protein [Rodentibacter caecimuris]|uniref:hypothetical protein n=1 Tax=Rodentibacter caecimuris TaxID=1796644 RepID=UPI0012FF8747|nr:hypothetical protein [Rodentibacter heylii]
METELSSISNLLRIISVLLFVICALLTCLIFKPNPKAKRASIEYSSNSNKPKGD